AEQSPPVHPALNTLPRNHDRIDGAGAHVDVVVHREIACRVDVRRSETAVLLEGELETVVTVEEASEDGDILEAAIEALANERNHSVGSVAKNQRLILIMVGGALQKRFTAPSEGLRRRRTLMEISEPFGFRKNSSISLSFPISCIASGNSCSNSSCKSFSDLTL